jgi:hypothetical protein
MFEILKYFMTNVIGVNGGHNTNALKSFWFECKNEQEIINDLELKNYFFKLLIITYILYNVFANIRILIHLNNLKQQRNFQKENNLNVIGGENTVTRTSPQATGFSFGATNDTHQQKSFSGFGSHQQNSFCGFGANLQTTGRYNSPQDTGGFRFDASQTTGAFGAREKTNGGFGATHDIGGIRFGSTKPLCSFSQQNQHQQQQQQQPKVIDNFENIYNQQISLEESRLSSSSIEKQTKTGVADLIKSLDINLNEIDILSSNKSRIKLAQSKLALFEAIYSTFIFYENILPEDKQNLKEKSHIYVDNILEKLLLDIKDNEISKFDHEIKSELLVKCNNITRNLENL